MRDQGYPTHRATEGLHTREGISAKRPNLGIVKVVEKATTHHETVIMSPETSQAS